MMDQNLMDLGIAAPLASRLANAGTGPITVAASASGTQIQGTQFVVFVGSGTGNLKLPAIGGSDNAAQLGDDFVFHNGTGAAITVTIPSGVTVSLSGSGQTGTFTIGAHQAVSAWVVSSTQWMAQAG